MGILNNIAGYPALVSQTDGHTDVLLFNHHERRFEVLYPEGVTDAEIEEYVVQHSGYYLPKKIPLFDPPYRSAALTVTGHCNMDCPYCFVYPVPTKSHLAPENAAVYIRALAEYMTSGSKQLYLWGGEPTQNPSGLFAALNTVKETFNDDCTVTLTTNGFVDSDVLNKLTDYNFLELQISFDGNAQDTQKSIPGGSYNRVLESIHVAAVAMKTKPIVRMTVTDRNAAELRDTVTWILENKLTERVCIEPVHAYVGRSVLQADTQPDPDAYSAALLDTIEYAEQCGCKIYSQPLRPLQTRRAYDWGFINILPNGTAVSTVAIIDHSHPDTDQFLSGHINAGRLILNENIKNQQTRFKHAMASRCVHCPVFAVCKGNELRDDFVSGRIPSDYRCKVFKSIMRQWMERMLPAVISASDHTAYLLPDRLTSIKK